MKRIIAAILSIILMCYSVLASANTGNDTSCNAADAPQTQDDGFDSEAFTAAFDAGILTLKKLELPGTEDIRWISISPKGSYLFGYQQGAGYGLYDVAQQHFTLLTVDTSGDTYECLERAIGLSPDYLEVVWSPDEQYFSITNYKRNIIQCTYDWDLFLGDTQTSTIRVLQTWNRRVIKDDFGTAVSPCFSEDSCSLYYTFYGNIEGERKYQTYEYNLVTGENTLLFVNAISPEYLLAYFFCMDDGRFIELKNNHATGKDALYLFYPDGEKWNSTSFEIGSLPEFANVEIFSNLRLCKIDEQRFALIFQADNNMYSLLFQINEANQFEVAPDTYTQEIYLADQDVKVVIDDTYARNIQPSPDGKYFLSVNSDKSQGRRFGLWVSNTDKKYDGTPEEVKVTLPEEFSSDGVFYYCMGENPLSVAMTQGMQWGGDLVLLSPTDVCYFEAAIDAPWNWKTDLAGTSWMCITPMIATVKFLDEGVFTMSGQGEEITGEYQWMSFNTVALTAYEDTLLFVFEENTLRFESEDGIVTFHYAK